MPEAGNNYCNHLERKDKNKEIFQAKLIMN